MLPYIFEFGGGPADAAQSFAVVVATFCGHVVLPHLRRSFSFDQSRGLICARSGPLDPLILETISLGFVNSALPRFQKL